MIGLMYGEPLRAFTSQPAVARSGDALVLVRPQRRAPDTIPGPPPAVPAGIERVTPITVDVLVRRRSPKAPEHTLRQTFSRTADRVHLTVGDGREWLFERNTRDPRRASAALVEHSSRTIVIYDESDLRTRLGIRGWSDVFTLGFEAELLSGLRATGEVRATGPFRFARYATDRRNGSIADVWWSAEQMLPSEFSTTDGSGSTQFAVRGVRVDVDRALLHSPALRFPTYRVYDLADWLERHEK